MEAEKEFTAHGWRVMTLDTVDSTNAALKRLPDAPDGTAMLAYRQTQGRGRLGRSFCSPPGGVYLSVLLRPELPTQQLLHLTVLAAVAARRAVCDCCALPVQIKWTNDLVCNGKKVGGILTELVGSAVIIGIGINADTPAEAFSPELSFPAASLRMLSGSRVDVQMLALALLHHLQELRSVLAGDYAPWLAEYTAHCVTLGRTVLVLQNGEQHTALAEGIDAQGGLQVLFENGERDTLRSGEATVRAENGYY